MPMYNLIEYSDNYSKTSRSLWQYYKDESDDNLVDSKSFKSKVEITGSTPADGNTKNAEIIVSLKCLSNFWITLEMPLISCDVNLVLKCSKYCFIVILKHTKILEELLQVKEMITRLVVC